jgi:hypothetical protein
MQLSSNDSFDFYEKYKTARSKEVFDQISKLDEELGGLLAGGELTSRPLVDSYVKKLSLEKKLGIYMVLGGYYGHGRWTLEKSLEDSIRVARLKRKVMKRVLSVAVFTIAILLLVCFIKG